VIEGTQGELLIVAFEHECGLMTSQPLARFAPRGGWSRGLRMCWQHTLSPCGPVSWLPGAAVPSPL